jgi:hypothetical protein
MVGDSCAACSLQRLHFIIFIIDVTGPGGPGPMGCLYGYQSQPAGLARSGFKNRTPSWSNAPGPVWTIVLPDFWSPCLCTFPMYLYLLGAPWSTAESRPSPSPDLRDWMVPIPCQPSTRFDHGKPSGLVGPCRTRQTDHSLRSQTAIPVFRRLIGTGRKFCWDRFCFVRLMFLFLLPSGKGGRT